MTERKDWIDARIQADRQWLDDLANQANAAIEQARQAEEQGEPAQPSVATIVGETES